MLASTWSSLRSAILLAGLAITGSTMGLGAGALWRAHISESAAHERDMVLKSGLEASLNGIAVGSEFPDVPLMDLETGSLRLVRDLLPHGGVILYLAAECESCRETVKELCEVGQLGSAARHPTLVLIAGYLGYADSLDFTGHANMRFVTDSAMTLATSFGITIFPSIFALDERQVIQEIDVKSGGKSEVLKRIL